MSKSRSAVLEITEGGALDLRITSGDFRCYSASHDGEKKASRFYDPAHLVTGSFALVLQPAPCFCSQIGLSNRALSIIDTLTVEGYPLCA